MISYLVAGALALLVGLRDHAVEVVVVGIGELVRRGTCAIGAVRARIAEGFGAFEQRALVAPPVVGEETVGT